MNRTGIVINYNVIITWRTIEVDPRKREGQDKEPGLDCTDGWGYSQNISTL
jgi:hypothetical protein